MQCGLALDAKFVWEALGKSSVREREANSQYGKQESAKPRRSGPSQLNSERKHGAAFSIGKLGALLYMIPSAIADFFRCRGVGR
jgi:hypothetical protein